jgi:hypothetical protein
MSGATLGRPLVSLLALSAFNQPFASHREAFISANSFASGGTVAIAHFGAVELHIDFRMLG